MGVGEIIFQEISKHGPIPFSRFMELALYCPDCGFYEKEADTVGRRGDFYTSVSVGSLFGELLAFNFAGKLTELVSQNSGLRPQLIEAGAHDGKLARDVLNWIKRQRPQLYDRMEYVIVEPSKRRQQWQHTTLAGFDGKVRWVDHIGDFRFAGVLLANELLDALPVRRIGWDVKSRQWFEWGVGSDDDQFVWARLSLTSDDTAQVVAALNCPPELLDALPDGFTTELCPAATAWWTQVANALTNGQLVTFDYGLTAEDFFRPQRKDGTLRSYHRHQPVPDVLAQPGEQDITAHVNFSAIRKAGESAGLRTEFDGTQSQFLTRITSEAWKQDAGFGEWQATQTRQFQTLTHPDFLGRSFRVLIQSR